MTVNQAFHSSVDDVLLDYDFMFFDWFSWNQLVAGDIWSVKFSMAVSASLFGSITSSAAVYFTGFLNLSSALVSNDLLKEIFHLSVLLLEFPNRFQF
jgi:hypothetical protein